MSLAFIEWPSVLNDLVFSAIGLGAGLILGYWLGRRSRA